MRIQLLLMTLFVGFVSGATAIAQDLRPLPSFITTEAFAALTVRTGDVFAMPEMELLPTEVISAASLKEFGFDAMDLDEALVYSEPPTRERGDAFCIALRFKKSADLSKAFLTLEASHSLETSAGKKRWVAKSAGMPSVLMFDRQTILIGMPDMLEKASAAPMKSPLADKLKAITPNHHASLVVLMPPIRPLVGEVLKSSPIPPPFSMFARLPELVEQMEVHLDLGSKGASLVKLQANDTDAAEQVEFILNSGLEMGKQAALMQLRQLDINEPVQEAMSRYAKRLATHFEGQLKPRRDAKVVSLEVKSEKMANVSNVGIMVSLLLPAVQSAREAARRMESANNLKYIALAMHNHQSVYKRLPEQSNKDKEGKVLLSWRVHLLPFLEEQPLYDAFRLDEPWDSENNIKLLDRMPKVFRSPNSVHTNKSNYLLPLGKGTPFSIGKSARLDDMLDGTSNTILVVEASDAKAVPWTKPDDYEIDPKNPMAGLLGLRPGGFQVAFADGAVRFISQTVDPAILLAMFTGDGGESFDFPERP